LSSGVRLATLTAGMQYLPDERRARLLLEAFKGWFGTPVVKLGGRVLDGRKRLAAWRSLSCHGDPPTISVRETRAAGRLLLLAGHVERCAELLGDSIPYDANTATLLRVPSELGALLVGHVRRRGRKPTPRRHRQEVVDRVRELYLRAIEAGEPITPTDLRRALGTWA